MVLTYSLLVDDLDNSGQFGVVNQHNTAVLDVSPVGGFHGSRHDVFVEKVGEPKKPSSETLKFFFSILSP